MMSSRRTSFLVLALALIGSAGSAFAEVVLSEKIMSLSKTAAELSAEVYLPEPNCTTCSSLKNFIDEPDQALLAESGGYCYGVFRGTTLTFVDWKQNFDPRSEPVCTAADKSECCITRQGFYSAHHASYYADIEAGLRECAKKCKNRNECVVLAGHSQGGAVAAVAAVRLADINPRVITFGAPPTLDYPCRPVTSARWYRFVNTKDSTVVGTVGVTYDPIPFVPGMGTEQFGHFILLGGDVTGTAFIGLDSNEDFFPLNVGGFEAHSMKGSEEYPGYLDRIESLIDNANKTYPIRSRGFTSPAFCTKDIECESRQCKKERRFSYSTCHADECDGDDDCETGRCDSGQCLPKLGSCLACDEDSDCAGGHCIFFRCTNLNGKMDEECTCVDDEQCESGRCEPEFALAAPTCRARLGEGAGCDEDTDCLSNHCSWKFRCEGAPLSISDIEIASSQGDGDRAKLIAFGVIVALGALVCGGLVIRNKRKDYEEIPGTTI